MIANMIRLVEEVLNAYRDPLFPQTFEFPIAAAVGFLINAIWAAMNWSRSRSAWHVLFVWPVLAFGFLAWLREPYVVLYGPPSIIINVLYLARRRPQRSGQ